MNYRQNFDHLGRLVASDFRISDFVICGLAFGVIVALASGVLA
jgi:hypothetical protein